MPELALWNYGAPLEAEGAPKTSAPDADGGNAVKPASRSIALHSADHPLPPVVDGDKETKGRILIIAGSREVPGAALLTATAAMRAGAGKLRIATVESASQLSSGWRCPKPWSSVLAEADDGGLPRRRPSQIAKQAGEGRLRRRGPRHVQAMPCVRRSPTSLLASNAAAGARRSAAAQPRAGRRRRVARSPVLLPNAGELASLLDCDEEEIERDPFSCGLRAAQLYRSVVLVKGVTSHVVTADGQAGPTKAARRDLAFPEVATCWRASSAGCSRAVRSRSMHCSGPSGCTARPARSSRRKIGPIGFLAREIADEVPRLCSPSRSLACSGRARRRSGARRAARWSSPRSRTEFRPSARSGRRPWRAGGEAPCACPCRPSPRSSTRRACGPRATPHSRPIRRDGDAATRSSPAAAPAGARGRSAARSSPSSCSRPSPSPRRCWRSAAPSRRARRRSSARAGSG